MDSFKDIQKLQELFDGSKSALVLPVIFSFFCVLFELAENLPIARLRAIHELQAYKLTRTIFENGYSIYFMGAVGVAMFAHYVSPAILLYITLVFFVAFRHLPLLHKNEHFKRGVIEGVFLLLIGGYFLLAIFEISF